MATEPLMDSFLLAILISVAGWLIKKELVEINNKLASHDRQILELTGSVRELVGAFNIVSKRVE
jgi:hypothetical protein